jgi:hypothetical protein
MNAFRFIITTCPRAGTKKLPDAGFYRRHFPPPRGPDLPSIQLICVLWNTVARQCWIHTSFTPGLLGEQDLNSRQLSGANLADIRGTRSDAYLVVRERRVTKKIGQIRPPFGNPENGRFLPAAGRSSLLLLEVPQGTPASSRLEIVSFSGFST